MCVCVFVGRGVSYYSLGLFIPGFLSAVAAGWKGAKGERNSSLGVTGWLAPQGRASLQWWSMGALFPGPSLSRIRELMGQGDKGSLSCVSCLDSTPTETPVEFVGVAHTNVTGVGVGCGESLKALGGKKRNKAVKEADH